MLCIIGITIRQMTENLRTGGDFQGLSLDSEARRRPDIASMI
jgi:hypothetical protein